MRQASQTSHGYRPQPDPVFTISSRFSSYCQWKTSSCQFILAEFSLPHILSPSAKLVNNFPSKPHQLLVYCKTFSSLLASALNSQNLLSAAKSVFQTTHIMPIPPPPHVQESKRSGLSPFKSFPFPNFSELMSPLLSIPFAVLQHCLFLPSASDQVVTLLHLPSPSPGI